ncbi:MAG: ANTAR domain-containing protein [Capsulimonadales bacterium]|nr:ANTAR domain-containing protein [Capsulimonadales bacterium]
MRLANVLIADPDPQTRQELRAILTSLGHPVVGEAESGSQTLSLVRSLRPELLLLEVSLAGVSGPDLLQSPGSERAPMAIILTGADTDDTRIDFDSPLVMGFVSRPYRATDLRFTVPTVLARCQERHGLEEEVRALNERMEARKLVGRAKAILMERHGLSERDAFKRIQSQSIALGKQAHEIAQAIITASEIAGGGNSASSSRFTAEPGEGRPSSVRPIRCEKASLDAIQP